MSSIEWNSRIGEVSTVSHKVIVVEITVDAERVEYDLDAEYVLRVNGRMVKRLNAWQACRLGITQDLYANDFGPPKAVKRGAINYLDEP